MMYLFYYFICINIFSFFIYGIDKFLAVHNKRRVRELFLHLLSLLGGFLGCILGMMFFRHKTRKLRFYIWNILMFVLWIYIMYIILF